MLYLTLLILDIFFTYCGDLFRFPLKLTLPATVFIFFTVVRLIIPRARFWIVLAAVLPLGCGGIGKISSINFLSLGSVRE
jgi:hypothetical protein